MRCRGIRGGMAIFWILLISASGAEAAEEDGNGTTSFVSVLGGISAYRNSEIVDAADKASGPFPSGEAYNGSGFTAGAAVGIGGRFFEHQLRGDYRRSKAEKSAADFRVISVMYQPTLKVPVRESWFYLGLGIGAAQGKTTLSGKVDGIYCLRLSCRETAVWELPVSGIVDDWEFAYQLSAGFVYALTEQIGLELAYRYIGTTQFDVQKVPHYAEQNPPIDELPPGGVNFQPDLITDDLLSFGANEVTFGLRYQFR